MRRVRGRSCPSVWRTYDCPVAKGEKLIADNRRARHDYELLDRLEAGVVLTGTEVKALRESRATIAQAYADVRGEEVWLVGAHIPEYKQANRGNHDPDRPRKLLMHRHEIERLVGRTQERGLTLVPTRMYFRGPRAKVEIALARGKDVGDKRRALKEREQRREIERALSEMQR